MPDTYIDQAHAVGKLNALYKTRNYLQIEINKIQKELDKLKKPDLKIAK